MVDRQIDDGGQLLPLVVPLLLLAGAMAWLVGEVAEVVVDRARARTAADAAALAAAVHRPEGTDVARWAAMDLAEANGGVLMGFRSDADGVEVTVRVGRARATARSVARPGSRPVGPGSDP